MSKQTDVVIENAADVIREALHTFQGGRNWLSGSLTDQRGSYCLIGGVQNVLGQGNLKAGEKHPLYKETLSIIARVIRPKATIKAVKNPEAIAVSFNDSDRTTYARVEAILAAALVQARKLAGVGA